jgi:putative glutamine amidotransferase
MKSVACSITHMKPVIAIPEPVSTRPDYNERALPQYVAAIDEAGGEARVIALASPPKDAARVFAECDAVLLPGSPADVDPAKYKANTDPRTAAADPRRDNVDSILLREAYSARKPVLGICYGLQSLNVWRGGALVQHIESRINHEAGRAVARAHQVAIEPATRLASILGLNGSGAIPVNSSHHQSAAEVGDGLLLVATCPDDQIIEAIEGSDPAHFVLGVQWHPERTTDSEASSRAIFRAFVHAAAERHQH